MRAQNCFVDRDIVGYAIFEHDRFFKTVAKIVEGVERLDEDRFIRPQNNLLGKVGVGQVASDGY